MILKKWIQKYRTTVILYILIGIVIALLQALGVFAFQRLLDQFAQQRVAVSDVLRYGGYIMVACILNYIDNIPDAQLSNGIYLDLKLMALKKMRLINYTDYQDLGMGKLIQQIENGACAGRSILVDFYFRLFRELLPEMMISIIFIVYMNKNLVWFIFVGYVVVFIVSNRVLKRLYKIKNNILINEELVNHYIIRGIMELVVFRTNKRYGKEIRKAIIAADAVKTSKVKMRMIHEFFFAFFYLMIIVLKISIIFYGAISHTLSVGGVVAMMSFLDKAYNPISIFNVLYVQYKLDKITFQRYEDILFLKEDKALCEGENIDIHHGEIQFQNVSFFYQQRLILKDISFTIPPGCSVALVGESGAGKSTIIKLLIGLIKPHSGAVFIDGKDLATLALNHFYDYVSYTAQEAPIFNGTLYENIVFDQQVKVSEIMNVLRLVQLEDFCLSLEKGMYTVVGEKGVLLSGGERQRLALARIFFQKAQIIILDEATAAMDNITEARVMQCVREAFKDRTLVIVAHRLSSIQDVDHIVVLKSGGVVEEGCFEELLEIDGYFKALWHKQFSGN